MKVKEFLNIAYRNFSYIELDMYVQEDKPVKYVFNWTSMQRASEHPGLIPFLDHNVKYIFYDKNNPMQINIGLGESFTFTLPSDDPSTHILTVKNHEEVEKINSFIDDNRENGFLMVYSCSINIDSPSSRWLVYQWVD